LLIQINILRVFFSGIFQEQPTPVCGNGILETGENCDDSNLINGDGCSSICLVEEGGKEEGGGGE
jgi:cysteine-rich repeat protein